MNIWYVNSHFGIVVSRKKCGLSVNGRHPPKGLYTFLEHFPFARAFFQKIVKYFWAHTIRDLKWEYFLTCCGVGFNVNFL